ncbi:hypothetical protein HE1_00580 [Holospora elegans E1]|uniref:Transposase n=1 Tax=Holospora elegans E1 TaxID=1427503 RepID=A0A023DY74_9PROT|nr:hypothetical protein HE1_00580 [Holospora elegans E1]
MTIEANTTKKRGNAVCYIIKSGCQWTVHSFYRPCRIKSVWEKVMHELVKTSRIKYERSKNPSYKHHSQSVKTSVKLTGASEKIGIEGGKKDT